MSSLTNQDLLKLQEAGERAILEYAKQKFIQTGLPLIDEVLDGGIEVGNYYLILGPAKSGKSTFLRTLGLSLAKTTPVLYLNFEQLGRSTFSTLYKMHFGSSLREDIKTDPLLANENVFKMPDLPFYIAFWPDNLENKAFNLEVTKMLEASVTELTKRHEGRKPVIVFENLSDVYNERLGKNDNLVNIVTQTAQDIKNFAIKHEVAIFLAHHTGKIQGNDPTLDDARDSKRTVDLAHSIFTSYVHSETGDYMLKYLAGRSGTPAGVRWVVLVDKGQLRLTSAITLTA